LIQINEPVGVIGFGILPIVLAIAMLFIDS
jgi:hypothetical protein